MPQGRRPVLAFARASPYIRCLSKPTAEGRMSNFMTYLALAAMAAVAVVLVMGLFNMMRGGSGNRSQKLMRARVMLQGIAVIIIVGALLFMR